MANFGRKSNMLLNIAKVQQQNVHCSPVARSLVTQTGMVGQDIDTFRMFTLARDLLIITRLPDFNANAYVAGVESGLVTPKKSEIKRKTNDLAVVAQDGRLYVSDYDLMCMHKWDRTDCAYKPIEMSWDGKSPMSENEEKYLRPLNCSLWYPIQHGCNDNYTKVNGDGKESAGNPNIGNDFAVFQHGEILVINSFKDLKEFYREEGLKGFREDYRP